MKNKLRILGLALTMVIGIVACEKDSQTVTYQRPADKETMKMGKWKIDNFEINGLELAEHYQDYVFIFKSEDVLTAERHGRPVNGEWTVTDTNMIIIYRIFFGDDQYLNLLNNDVWKVQYQDYVTLKLEGKRGDDGVSEVTFKKQ